LCRTVGARARQAGCEGDHGSHFLPWPHAPAHRHCQTRRLISAAYDPARTALLVRADCTTSHFLNPDFQRSHGFSARCYTGLPAPPFIQLPVFRHFLGFVSPSSRF
jgi:hypothetical protein